MKSDIDGKKILLGIAGGIAAYKCCELARLLVKEGAEVKCVPTRAALEFVTPLTLQTLSKNPVYTEMFSFVKEREVCHISLADWADAVLIAPATADIMAKISCGICDELLTAVVCATRAKLVFAPSMNTRMWENAVTRENVERLSGMGYAFIGPSEGELACGYEGRGRMLEPGQILEELKNIL
ncbi:MAG TPA: flavoprotein [bacterium]|nr:flavoprotein [bacterium]